MEQYQIRVIKEQRELAERMGKLNVFEGTPAFFRLDPSECVRLRRQLDVMKTYNDILLERIEHFPRNDKSVREITTTLTLSADFSDMVAELENEEGVRMSDGDLRSYLWECFSESLGDSFRRLNEDSIEIEIYE